MSFGIFLWFFPIAIAVTSLLHLWYIIVTLLLCCYIVVTLLLHCCYSLCVISMDHKVSRYSTLLRNCQILLQRGYIMLLSDLTMTLLLSNHS